MALLNVLIKTVTGELVGYGFVEMKPAADETLLQVAGEMAMGLDIYDGQHRLKTKWDEKIKTFADIPEEERVVHVSDSTKALRSEWKSLGTASEKMQFIAKLLKLDEGS
jgi:hypothetical protein